MILIANRVGFVLYLDGWHALKRKAGSIPPLFFPDIEHAKHWAEALKIDGVFFHEIDKQELGEIIAKSKFPQIINMWEEV